MGADGEANRAKEAMGIGDNEKKEEEEGKEEKEMWTGDGEEVEERMDSYYQTGR